jgi:heat shock protein HtpX
MRSATTPVTTPVPAPLPLSKIAVGRLQEEVAANRRSQQFVATVVAVALAAVGTLLALPFGSWPVGLGAGLAVAILLLGFAPGVGERLALRALRARPSDPDRHPRYHNLVQGLCEEAGLPVPKLWVVDSDAANALALGRGPSESAIVVTRGLIERLNRVELEGVLAAELWHVRASSARLGSMAVVLGGLPGLLLQARRRGGGALLGVAGTVLLVLAPLRRLAVPPRRHLQADEGAIYLTRYPPGLIAALTKLDAAAESGSGAEIANLGLRHLWIVRPRPASPDSRLDRMFESHPPLEERLESLREL